MIQIEFPFDLCWQKISVGEVFFHEELCAIGTAKKRKKKFVEKEKLKKKKIWKVWKKSWKVEKKSSKVLFVEVMVQNNEFGPKELFKSPPCVLKLTSAL